MFVYYCDLPFIPKLDKIIHPVFPTLLNLCMQLHPGSPTTLYFPGTQTDLRIVFVPHTVSLLSLSLYQTGLWDISATTDDTSHLTGNNNNCNKEMQI